jgi:hypothetical protein
MGDPHWSGSADRQWGDEGRLIGEIGHLLLGVVEIVQILLDFLLSRGVIGIRGGDLFH